MTDQTDDWGQYLDAAVFATNTSTQSTTKVTPFRMMFSHEPHFPFEAEKEGECASMEDIIESLQSADVEDVLEKLIPKQQKIFRTADERIVEAQKKQKEQYKKRKGIINYHFKEGSNMKQKTRMSSSKSRPLLMPEPFTGTGSFGDWVDHFESVAAINEWDDAAKLLWMRVRLVGRAQTAYGRLSTMAKESYAALKKALKDTFKLDSRRELYLSKFSTRKRRPGEGWAEYADELRVLADKAFPELEEQARERLALNQYLGQLDNPHVAFNRNDQLA